MSVQFGFLFRLGFFSPERKPTFNQPKEGIEARETAMGTYKNDKDAGRLA